MGSFKILSTTFHLYLQKSEEQILLSARQHHYEYSIWHSHIFNSTVATLPFKQGYVHLWFWFFVHSRHFSDSLQPNSTYRQSLLPPFCCPCAIFCVLELQFLFYIFLTAITEHYEVFGLWGWCNDHFREISCKLQLACFVRWTEFCFPSLHWRKGLSRLLIKFPTSI